MVITFGSLAEFAFCARLFRAASTTESVGGWYSCDQADVARTSVKKIPAKDIAQADDSRIGDTMSSASTLLVNILRPSAGTAMLGVGYLVR